jgi:hypothetical protein
VGRTRFILGVYEETLRVLSTTEEQKADEFNSAEIVRPLAA